ncbi:MAG TPA: sigma-70 family RNA polymerase sigma factor [Actinomycetota bacterium]|nr:sigma-70 family RNA polymerase sigma factor [Actinomycetota bacterium]
MELMGDRVDVVSGPVEEGLQKSAEERLDFEGFFDNHHTALFRALWLVTRNRHEAEEIMQDAFLLVWERWDRVGSLSDPVGYLYRTAMNVFRSRVRRAKRAIRLAVGHLQADDELTKVEEREDVLRVLAPLTPRQRAAVVLTDLLGLSSEQAGEALRIKASTVRVLVARARAALRKEFGETDE